MGRMTFNATLIPYTEQAGVLPRLEMYWKLPRHQGRKRWHWALRDTEGKLLAADGLCDGFATAPKCWEKVLSVAYILSHRGYTLPSETPTPGSDMMCLDEDGTPILRIQRAE